MKMRVIIFSVGISIAGTLAWGGAQDTKKILLLSSPTVDSEISESTLGFAARNVKGAITEGRTRLSISGFEPKELLRIYSAMRTDSDALVIVLANTRMPDWPVVIYSEILGCAVVNIAEILEMKEIIETGRVARIQRASLYAIGRLGGLKSCLNPFCALSEYEHVQKDRIPGRNYCPNCTDRVGAGLKALGIHEPPAKRRSK